MIKQFLQKPISITIFALIVSVLQFLCFHFPFFQFVFQQIDYTRFNGILAVTSLFILVVLLNFFIFYLLLYLTRIVGRWLIALLFVINALAVYFVIAYGVIIDESMIGNVFNTNYEESSSFFSYKMVLFVLVFGVLPSVFIIKKKWIVVPFKRFLIISLSSFISIVLIGFINAPNWLWIDKNSTTLGGLVMPWSYVVNTSLYFVHKSQRNQKEIPLPDARIKDNKKAIMVLVIGESARSQNFSLYGYGKNTNPLLSTTPNVHAFKAHSCATYTTAGVKCILEHENTDQLYEILPNYLYRNQVDVIWRTTNWGEPPLHIEKILNKDALAKDCVGDTCDYDGILLKDLKKQILESDKDKILVVLHTSTSHGPTYSKKYPKAFEVFRPVCNSVELGDCSQEALLNAYDNTIVYTDYLLHNIINILKTLPDYETAMMYVSDHGESLGEKNLYMHGAPMSMAPKEQYEIPFIVWISDANRELKQEDLLTQNHVFHSVLYFLSIESPIYKEAFNIFK